MGLNPKFHQLDIESMESIQNFAEYLKNTYGGIDVLVNNAGVFPKVNYYLIFTSIPIRDLIQTKIDHFNKNTFKI